MNASIYYDSDLLALEWLPEILKNINGRVYTNLDEFERDAAVIKLAFTTHRLHCDNDAYVGFEDKINRLSSTSTLVFSWESELHHFHWGIWDRCHHDNVYWLVPGFVNSSMNDHIIFWGDWFKTTANLYKALPHKLAEIDPYASKPKMFDALLGSPKPHRDFVYNSVYESNLADQFIMPYGGNWDDNDFYAKDYFVWEPGVEVVGEQQAGTAGPVRYYGVWTGLSRVIPIQVFNDTAYSIVAETDHDNTLSFFSEKTAKPMLARRLFVVFSGCKFLHNLRQVGFQTFNSIIDESYDLIEDDSARYAAAFEQVKLLCSMDQQEVYCKIRPIAEHNYNLILTTDWTSYAAQQVRKRILSIF